MRHGGRQRWLLIRLAAQNVGRRRWRALLLAGAVTLGVGVGFAGFVAGWALSNGIAASLARMGADLVVVPREALVNITASLLTVQPTEASLPAGLERGLAAIPGIARVAAQRIVPVVVDGRDANLIAFDPRTDFSLLPWLDRHVDGPLDGDAVIGGSRTRTAPGTDIAICGRPMKLYGRFDKTGVGPVDDSWFVTNEGLAAIGAFCTQHRGLATGAADRAAPSMRDGHHREACLPQLPADRVSAFLLQLAPGAKIDAVRFALGQLPQVRVVEGNPVLTKSRQALGVLLLGIAVFTLVQLLAALIVVALLFSAMVQERWREVGLLRAMGATPGQIMALILGEAVILTGFGGLAGLAVGAALLLGFARTLGYYFALLGVPFRWPPLSVLQGGAIAALVFSALVGLIGAAAPAWRVRRMAPYSLIQGELR